MGMRVNLVDRSIYNLEPDTGHDPHRGVEHYQKRLAELRHSMLSEKDKFILSEKDTYAMLASPTEMGDLGGKADKAEFLLKKQMQKQ